MFRHQWNIKAWRTMWNIFVFPILLPMKLLVAWTHDYPYIWILYLTVYIVQYSTKLNLELQVSGSARWWNGNSEPCKRWGRKYETSSSAFDRSHTFSCNLTKVLWLLKHNHAKSSDTNHSFQCAETFFSFCLRKVQITAYRKKKTCISGQEPVNVGQMYVVYHSRLWSVVIAAVPNHSDSDRLLTSISRGIMTLIPVRGALLWCQPGWTCRRGIGPFKPILSPSIKLLICVGQKSLWHYHFSTPSPHPFSTHTQTHTHKTQFLLYPTILWGLKEPLIGWAVRPSDRSIITVFSWRCAGGVRQAHLPVPMGTGLNPTGYATLKTCLMFFL